MSLLAPIGRGLAAAALAMGLAAAPASAETLGSALVSAYNASHLLEQNRALLRATDEDAAIALSALRPIINYSSQIGYGTSATTGAAFSASLTLSVSILLYDFGATKLRTELAKEAILATRQSLIDVEQNVLFSAVQAYLNLIRAGEVVALRDNNVRLITQELRAAQDRFDLGEITVTDVSIAEARLALSRANYAAAQGDLQVARETYDAVIGHPPGTLSQPPAAPATAKTVEEAKAIALRRHPALLAAQRQVTIAEMNIKLAEKAMLPTVSAGASTTARNLGRSPTGQIGIELSGPIYQGGRLSAQYRKAVANRDATRAALLQQSVVVEQNVGIAWAQVRVSAAQLEASERQIRAARVAYRGVREEATLGARTTLDVLNSEQELLDAEAARISAFTDYYVATYGLLRAMGLLTAEHLRLGVMTYDPEAYYNAVKSAPTRKVSPQGQKLDRILKGLGKD